MQTAKIKTHEIYATNRRAQGPERFWVDAITIVKKGAHASDQHVTVTGRYFDKDGLRTGSDVTLQASDLLGPYTEYAALIAKEAEEKAEKARKEKAAEVEHERLWKRLYELTGHPLPKGVRSRFRDGQLEYNARDGDIFHRTYRGGFEVTNEGAAILIEALERAPRLKAVS